MDYKKKKTIAEPHEDVVIDYEKIVNEIERPPLSIDKMALKYNQLKKFLLDDKVNDVLKIMNENSFTQVPIIDDKGILQGVFSENTLASYLANNDLIIDKENSILKDFEEYLDIEKHIGEYYIFVPRDKNVYDIIDLFYKKIFLNNKYLSGIFITENGKKNRTTPWFNYALGCISL